MKKYLFKCQISLPTYFYYCAFLYILNILLSPTLPKFPCFHNCHATPKGHGLPPSQNSERAPGSSRFKMFLTNVIKVDKREVLRLYFKRYQDKIPPDKIPPDKIPRTKSPWTKSPLGQNPPRTKSPWTKSPPYILYFIDSNIFY